MPCHTTRCHAMPCHAMPCHAIPCYAMSFHDMPYHAMPCHIMPLCHAMPCHAKSCRAMLCPNHDACCGLSCCPPYASRSCPMPSPVPSAMATNLVTCIPHALHHTCLVIVAPSLMLFQVCHVLPCHIIPWHPMQGASNPPPEETTMTSPLARPSRHLSRA